MSGGAKSDARPSQTMAFGSAWANAKGTRSLNGPAGMLAVYAGTLPDLNMGNESSRGRVARGFDPESNRSFDKVRRILRRCEGQDLEPGTLGSIRFGFEYGVEQVVPDAWNRPAPSGDGSEHESPTSATANVSFSAGLEHVSIPR